MDFQINLPLLASFIDAALHGYAPVLNQYGVSAIFNIVETGARVTLMALFAGGFLLIVKGIVDIKRLGGWDAGKRRFRSYSIIGGALMIGSVWLFLLIGTAIDFMSRASGGAVVSMGAMSYSGSSNSSTGGFGGMPFGVSQSVGSSPQRARQPGSTIFADNDRTATMAGDRVSTFSLDIDRTSYQLAVNWARSGYDIDPDSVRAEEWVNAFDYDYDAPSNNDAFAIYTDVTDHPLDEDMIMARVGFQAPKLVDDGTPLNVTLVLDASGSMKDGDRVDIARAAAESIRDSLGEGDRIAVAHFTTGVVEELTVRHTEPGDRDVRRSIRALTPRESTNVQLGLNRGVELANEARRDRPDAYNYIILMSDGVANVDVTSPFGILESAADIDDANPLRLITIGVGISNYNDYLLEQLAQHGNGWYRYLDDVGSARRTFERENWLALSIPFADQTRAQVRWDPDVVKTWRILGYENRVTSEESFAEDRKEFAEIPSGAAITAFYEIELMDGAGELGAGVSLGDVEARWIDPKSRESMSQEAAIISHASGDMDETEYAYLRLGALVALAADRYGSPSDEERDSDRYGIRDDLETLEGELNELNGEIGDSGAYKDFAFLLRHMAISAPDEGDAGGRDEGYSR